MIKPTVASNTLFFNAIFFVSHDIKETSNGNLKTVKQIIYDWDNRNVRLFIHDDNGHGYYQWYNVDHKWNWNEATDIRRNELIKWP